MFCIGIDEVGRGPIAGPVTVGVVLLDSKKKMSDYRNVLGGLRDSKKLSEKKREEWYDWVIAQKIPWEVVSVSASVIDRIGIAPAARRAAGSALKKIVARTKMSPSTCEVRLDYGLSVSSEWQQVQIVKGDEKEPAIALASIMAKVTRDRYMKKLAQKHPSYGFEKHKGYGTRQHYAAIQSKGVCNEHRTTFTWV